MSADREHALRQRQQALVARSGELRASLAGQLRGWRPALSWADRVREGWHWLRAHPEAPIAAAVVVAVLRPRRALRWALRLWSGWRLWRSVQAQIRRTLPPPPA